jgi:hypothetical protein
MTFMRASGVRRGEGEDGVIDSPAAVGRLVDAGPAAGRPSDRAVLGRASITSVDAWIAALFLTALAEVVTRLGADRLALS